MKSVKLITISLTLLLSITFVFAEEIMSFDFSDSWGDHGITLEDYTDNGVTLNFSINELGIATDLLDNELVHYILMPEVFLPNDEGAPNLPAMSRYVALPQGTQANLSVIDYRTQIVENINMKPAPQLPAGIEDGPLVYNRDMNIYSNNAYYPDEPVMISEQTKIRGLDVVIVGITPFQYNPVTQELVIYRDFKIEIDFVGGTGHFGDDRLRSRWFDPIIFDLVINEQQIPRMDYTNKNHRNEYGYEYIVIVPDDPDFIAWGDSIRVFRNMQGIKTDVVTISDIGYNLFGMIKDYIEDAYNNWDIPPVAVLLLADHGIDGNTITSEVRTDHPAHSSSYISDHSYSDMNDNNLPDIILARITARDSVDLENMVTKFLDYELNPPTNFDYYNNPITAMGWEDDRWYQLCAEIVSGFWEYELGKEPVRQNAIHDGNPGSIWSSADNTDTIVDYFGQNGLGYIPDDPTYLHNYGWGANATTLNTNINNGAFMTLHRDHGERNGWVTPSYRIYELDLENDDLTFIFSINCKTGSFSFAPHCFTEAIHRHLYGALGVISPTDISYSFVNDTFVWGMFNNMWPQFMPDQNTTPEHRGVLPAFANAAGKYFLHGSNWPSNPQHKEITYRLYHHHGDAFTTVYTQMPQNLTVQHEPVMEAETNTFAVTADENALISLSVDGEIIGTGVGTGEPVLIDIEPQYPPTTVDIVVTKQDYYRYHAQIPVEEPIISVSGYVYLDGGDGNITDMEITFESDEHLFTVNPDENGFYSREFFYDDYGIYDVKFTLSDYYPVTLENINIEGEEPITLPDVTLKPIIGNVVGVSTDPSFNEAFNNIQSALDYIGDTGGGTVYIFAGTYSGSGNVELIVPYSNDPQNPYQIEIRGSTEPEDVIIDCENLYGVNYSGFIFDDEGYGTIADEYILRDIIIKNAKPAVDIVSGSPHIYKMTFENTSPGINILSGSPLISYSNFIDNSIAGSEQYETYGAGIYSEGNPVIENNEFHNCRAKITQYNPCVSYGGAIALHNSNGAIIRKNLFEENRAARGGAISVTESANIIISSNEMSGNTFSSPSLPPPPPHPDNHPDSDGLAVYIEAVDSLYFDYNLIYLNGDNIQDNKNTVTIINVDNIDFVNNTVMDNTNHVGLHLSNVGSMDIINTVLYSNFENLSVVGNSPNISYSLISEDPKLNGQYKPRWEATLVSPAIDTGDPDLPWDPDDTPPDIGAVRAIEHDFHITTGPPEEPERYLWRSFPVMDRIYNAGEEVLYVLEPVEVQTDYFKIFDQEGLEVIWLDPNWDPVEFDYFDSVLGYKAESDADFSIPTSGIKQSDNTVVTLDAHVENWRGYFIEETNSIDVALADIWDKLIAVYSEDWAWHVESEKDPSLCTMIYGKMYKIIVEEPCEFVYGTGEPPYPPNNERTMTDGFYYSETPMYSVIMIDEIDDPEAVEIGVFQDDVCIGATQIEDEPVQILAFPQDSSRSNLGGNIHFELYYGQRSENKRIREYTVRESQGSLSSAKLSLAPYKFNYVTLDSEPDEPITQLTTTNYPNPFNPETTISYSLPNDTHVEIEIFNIKGQLVKRLVDGEQPAGRYQTVWNGKNDNGRSVGSGVYFYRITTDEKIIREKMLLLK